MTRTSFSSHLTILKTTSSTFPSRPAFRIPKLAEATGDVERWDIITYQQFFDDIERVARHWIQTLRTANIPPRAVVGVWLSGWSYSDVVHTYSLFRAGYVPQLFSLKLPNPDVIFELLKKANAQALIYEPSFEINMDKSPVPLHKPADITRIGGVEDEQLPPLAPVIDGEDVALIFHSSGSTSGSPKLVPCSYQWLDSNVHKARTVSIPRDSNHLIVTTWMGSICHIGQTLMFLSSLQYGACTVRPTQIAFSSEELADMVERCGLNRVTQFSPFLGAQLRKSYSDPKLLSVLQSLEELLYTGLDLSKEEECWARQNGILIRNVFGTTESGVVMLSVGGRGSDAPLLRLVDGPSYAFPPIDSTSSKPHPETSGVLREMVFLSTSKGCPHPSLRSPTDGHFHTGDLFEELSPGYYVFRGRNDDWIKSENGLRCDTKSIEDNVRSTCSDLVAECVVVGTGRPSPALFVEPKRGDIEPAELQEEILTRIHDFHARRYVHERIVSLHMIIVVARGTLPRTATKGNIRRKAVEEAYKEKLEEAYSSL